MRVSVTTGKAITVLVAMLWAAGSYAQQGSGSASGAAPGTSSVGVFAGFTDVDALGGGSEPTIGGEYDYQLEGPWSVGGILEHTSDAFFASDATLALGVLNYRVESQPRLKITGGAGMEFNDFGDDVRLRAGVGYDFIQGPVTLTPRLSVDFGNGREHLVLGATAYFPL